MDKMQILKHIKAAKMWLDKAENWIENNNIAKALTTLLLASCEIQIPLRKSMEVSKERKERKSKILRISKVAIAASFILIVGIIGYLIFNLSEPTKIVVKEERPKIETAKTETLIVSILPEEKIQEPSIIETPIRKKTKEPYKKREVQVAKVQEVPTALIIKEETPKEIAQEDVEKVEKKFTEIEILELVKIADKTLKGIQ